MKLPWFAVLVSFLFAACEDSERNAEPKSAPKVVKDASGAKPQAWRQVFAVSSSYKPASAMSNASVQTGQPSTKDSAKNSTKQSSTATKIRQTPTQVKPAAKSLTKKAQAATKTRQITPTKKPQNSQQQAAQNGQGTIIIRPSDPNAPRKTHVWQAAPQANQASVVEQNSSAREAWRAAPSQQTWSSEPEPVVEEKKAEEEIGKNLGKRRRLGATPKHEAGPEKQRSTPKRAPAAPREKQRQKKKSITPSTQF